MLFTETQLAHPQTGTSSRSRADSSPGAGSESDRSNALCPTVFHERWWLDATTGGQWHAAEVREHGRVVGWLPYLLSRRKGFRVSELPALTHVLGPAIDAGGGSANKQWLRRLGIAAELAAQVPRVALFSQACHPDTRDLLGFQGHGFDTYAQFSAEVAPQPEASLWAGLRDKTRNVIRRSQEVLQVSDLHDPGAFAEFYKRNLALQGKRSYFEFERFSDVWDAAHRRGCARMLAARDAGRRIVAAAFYVWDARRCWYVLSSRHPALSDNGATSLLVWTGMREAALRGHTFDFHGIASAGSARFYSGFGARIYPRLHLHRKSAGYAIARTLADALRGRTRNCHTAP